MIIPLFLSLLHLGSVVPAQAIIVYAKGDSAVIQSAENKTGLLTPSKAAFHAAVSADLTHPAAYDPPIALTDFPQYGRDVPGASGEAQFHHSFSGGCVAKISLAGLLPNHRYILTLNGNPEKSGNALLVDTVPGNEREKYYDFQTVTTDAHGGYLATFGIALATGSYDVRLYVKDTADFKIVLYHDFFRFEVR